MTDKRDDLYPITTQILSPTTANIRLAAMSLLKGEVVGMPTETVYGLAGNIHLPQAVERIFAAKERPSYDPLIVHVFWKRESHQHWGRTCLAELEHRKIIDLSSLTFEQQEKISLLIEAFWPGPLTLVMPKHPSVTEAITSGLPTVAVRMPLHPVAQALLAEADVPLAAPSANRFGRISPTSAADVMSELKGRVPYILDGGRCQVGVESTILHVGMPPLPFVLLRPGGVSLSQMEKVLAMPVQKLTKEHTEKVQKEKKYMSPGLLEGHYAPTKPLQQLPIPLYEMSAEELLDWWKNEQNDLNKKDEEKEINPSTFTWGFLLLSGDAHQLQEKLQFVLGLKPEQLVVESLSAEGNMVEAARNLFKTLRFLDQSPAQRLYADPCFQLDGPGAALADRLKRACHH